MRGFCVGRRVSGIAEMGGHGGPVPGEHRRVRVPAVRQLHPVRAEVRLRRVEGHHPVRDDQPAGDQGTVPARQRHRHRIATGADGRRHDGCAGRGPARRSARGRSGGDADGRRSVPRNRRPESVPVLLQPRVPGQSCGRVRLAPHHQDPGGRRGHTLDTVFRVVRGALLLVLSGVEKRVHDRQEKNGGGQKRKSPTRDQVSGTVNENVVVLYFLVKQRVKSSV